jgi:hypothetical protein
MYNCTGTVLYKDAANQDGLVVIIPSSNLSKLSNSFSETFTKYEKPVEFCHLIAFQNSGTVALL